MPEKSKPRAAKGSGTIRERNDGTWEARYTVGRDPGTGKQKQKSIYGKSKKEVAEKLRAKTHEIDNGTYIEPSRMTVGEWLDEWLDTYHANSPEGTRTKYATDI